MKQGGSYIIRKGQTEPQLVQRTRSAEEARASSTRAETRAVGEAPEQGGAAESAPAPAPATNKAAAASQPAAPTRRQKRS